MPVNLTKKDREAIANAVWAKTINDMQPTGIGYWLYKTLLTVARFIGIR